MPSYQPPGNWQFVLQNLIRADPVLNSAHFSAANTQLYARRHLGVPRAATFDVAAATIAAEATVQPPTVYHILIVGQSNAYGVTARFTDRSPVTGGFMFNGGVAPGSGAGIASLVTLADKAEQTIAPTMAAYLWQATSDNPGGGENRAFLISNVAVSGFRLDQICKGTQAYSDSLVQVLRARNLADAVGSDYHFIGICCLHGETDDGLNTAGYEAALATYQHDYETDIKAITGQPGNIPIYIAQHHGQGFDGSGRTPPAYDYATTISTLRNCISHPDDFKFVCPQYQYPKPDTVHQSSAARRHEGELFGKAIYRDYFQGDFTPFLPLSAVRTGAVIDVSFQVPVAPLRWDFVNGPSFRVNYGFDYWDDEDHFLPILSVALHNATTVRITLSATPTGGSQRLLYGGLNQNAFPFTFGGNLADSDTASSLRGYPHYNFCPHFILPVT